jgi:glucose/arabinose dehydrogenase
VVAWGLRNPYGIAFAPDGRLFATEHGIDERNPRHIIGDLEDFYEIVEGGWYGWPDFASGIRLDDPVLGRGRSRAGAGPRRTPGSAPAETVRHHPRYSGPNGADFCRDPAFGFQGDAFVTLFGDLAPVTARLPAPSGFKVVRVDMDADEIVDFAANRITGPTSRLPHAGMERPSHCRFGPDGNLYIVDFGEVPIAPEKGGIRIWEGTRRAVADPAHRRPRRRQRAPPPRGGLLQDQSSPRTVSRGSRSPPRPLEKSPPPPLRAGLRALPGRAS